MAKKVMVWSVWVVLALIVISPTVAVNAISCQEAVTKIGPCVAFLTNKGGLTATCCAGAQSLNQRLSSRKDRKEVCECFKKAAPTLRVDPERARELPQLCQIDLPVTVDPNVACDKVLMKN